MVHDVCTIHTVDGTKPHKLIQTSMWLMMISKSVKSQNLCFTSLASVNKRKTALYLLILTLYSGFITAVSL